MPCFSLWVAVIPSPDLNASVRLSEELNRFLSGAYVETHVWYDDVLDVQHHVGDRLQPDVTNLASNFTNGKKKKKDDQITVQTRNTTGMKAVITATLKN
eukprot:scaffold10345_cov158-Cylindrotheca_fusiformis.AAC.9